jgi:hypothetical protein
MGAQYTQGRIWLHAGVGANLAPGLLGGDVLTLLRFACRLALAAACLALAALWVEPHWVSQKRTLELRVRRGPEVFEVARSAAGRAWTAARERDLPAVSSGSEHSEPQSDELTDEDRRLLQRLVEEKLRE